MKIGLRFEGGDAIAAALAQMSARVGAKMLREALREAAEPIRARMASAAPRGTPQAPNLAQSMNIANARPKGESAAVAIAVGPSRDVFYGLMQELGTSRHGAKPFARPAFDEKTRQALLIVQSRLWAALTARGLAGSRGSGGGGVGL